MDTLLANWQVSVAILVAALLLVLTFKAALIGFKMLCGYFSQLLDIHKELRSLQASVADLRRTVDGMPDGTKKKRLPKHGR